VCIKFFMNALFIANTSFFSISKLFLYNLYYGLRSKKAKFPFKVALSRLLFYFLIDGFNFYYSIVRVQEDSNIKAKCFNYRALCEFYKNDFQSKKQKLSKSLEKYF
jgi:hypothetical protein